MPEFNVNFLAVFVAALVPMVLGALWYSPLMFGKAWMKAHGYTSEELQEMQKSMGKTYLISFVAYIVLSFVLAVVLSMMGWMGTATAGDGAMVGALLWLGFLATVGLTAHLFSDKPMTAYFLDAGFQLVYMVIMGVILAVW